MNQRAMVDFYTMEDKEELEYWRSRGHTRIEGFKGYDDVSVAMRIFELELRIRFLERISNAWKLIERKRLNNPVILKAMTLHITICNGTQELLLEDIQTVAAVAILVN